MAARHPYQMRNPQTLRMEVRHSISRNTPHTSRNIELPMYRYNLLLTLLPLPFSSYIIESSVTSKVSSFSTTDFYRYPLEIFQSGQRLPAFFHLHAQQLF